MKVRKQVRKIALHRETVLSLDLRKADGAGIYTAGCPITDFCTKTHPTCETASPC
jgi:hypothetical protein